MGKKFGFNPFTGKLDIWYDSSGEYLKLDCSNDPLTAILEGTGFTDGTASLTGGALTGVTGGIQLDADNAKLYFGAGDDIYHQFTGTNFETVGTGDWDISGFDKVDLSIPLEATTITGTTLTDGTASLTGGVLTDVKLGTLTDNGFVKTGSGDGTLSVDTSTYLTGNETITLSGQVTGSGATSITATLDKTAISDQADTVILAGDTLLFGDATDTNALKKDTVQGILDLISEEVNNFSYETVATGVTVTIPTYQQMIVYEEFTEVGTLIEDGELVVLN